MKWLAGWLWLSVTENISRRSPIVRSPKITKIVIPIQPPKHDTPDPWTNFLEGVATEDWVSTIEMFFYKMLVWEVSCLREGSPFFCYFWIPSNHFRHRIWYKFGIKSKRLLADSCCSVTFFIGITLWIWFKMITLSTAAYAKINQVFRLQFTLSSPSKNTL